MSPAGQTFNQTHAKRLLNDYDHLILVCGHYEGIDERFIEECVDEELSIGDFVMTGGELPAMCVADAVARHGPPAFSLTRSALKRKATSTECWSIPNIPALRCGTAAPCRRSLLSGHHANIQKWRRKQSILRTRQRRPDMYEKLDLSSKADQKLLKELEDEEQ